MANEYRLQVAAERGDMNLLYTLIQEDPYVLERLDSIPFVQTPLHVAAFKGHLEFATEVMRLKPSFAWKLNQQGFSPIHLAMQNNQKSMVLRFLKVDSNLVRVKGREGITPLHVASQIGAVDLLVNFLCACPDSIEDVTVWSETALHIAVKIRHYESLRVLVDWLKRNRERGAKEMEKMTLNWKDVAGNTILHISAHNNDLQAIGLLVKTKIDLKAKNLNNSTALNMATSAEIKTILSNADKEPRSSISKALTFVDELSKTTIVDEIVIPILRTRKDISEEQRNGFLIIAGLVATATYQAVLSPPGGVLQANAGDDNNASPTSSNSPGKSVMVNRDFIYFYTFNTLSFATSILILFILTPSGVVGRLLSNLPVFWLAICYVWAMHVISPSWKFIVTVCCIYIFLHGVVDWTLKKVDKFLSEARNKEINKRNSAGGNKW